jgi:uncharacterized RDD family membrane protein YckC
VAALLEKAGEVHVEYEDRIRIDTPEGVALELTLAGVGSRFVAAIVDWTIQILLLIGVGVMLSYGGSLQPAEGTIEAAIFSIVLFLVFFGYDVLFEVFASGRTPGKRWTGLRVVRTGGQPVGFLTSTIRNLLRLIDIQPFPTYFVGCVSVIATRKNQRLGDLAAGTIVMREHGAAKRREPVTAPVAALPAPTAAWDVSAVTAEELATVRAFLERRSELTPAARTDLASTLADRLRPKVAGGAAAGGSESFLEQLAAVKATRG